MAPGGFVGAERAGAGGSEGGLQGVGAHPGVQLPGEPMQRGLAPGKAHREQPCHAAHKPKRGYVEVLTVLAPRTRSVCAVLARVGSVRVSPSPQASVFDQVGKRVDQSVAGRQRGGAGGKGLDEQKLRVVGLLLGKAHHRRHGRPGRVVGRVGKQRKARLVEHALRDPGQRGKHAPVEIHELLIEGGARGAGLRDHVGDVRGGIPITRRDMGDGVDQPPPRGRRSTRSRQRVGLRGRRVVKWCGHRNSPQL